MAAVTANSGTRSAFIAFLSGLLMQVSELTALLLLVLLSALSGRNRLAGGIAQPLPSGRLASKDFPPRSQSPSSPREEDEDADEKRKIPTIVTFRTPLRQLFKAIVSRDMDRVFRLLETAPFLASTKHKDGWYPIHAAILTGDIDMVKLVAEHCQDFGVSLSIECYSYDEDRISSAALQTREEELGHSARLMKISGVKPLHLACLIGSTKIIEYLIEKGANMKEQDKHDRGPLDFFDGEEHEEALNLFCERVRAREERELSFHEVTIEALFDAMKKNKKSLFESLLSQKADLVNERTSQGFTILQAATIRQLTPYVKAVLTVRVLNINVKDKRSEDSDSREDHEFALYRFPHEFVKGATALHYACLTANLEIIELLLKAGAEWTAKDSQGRLPEDLFCDKFDRDIKLSFIQLRDQELKKMKGSPPVIQVVDEEKVEAKVDEKAEKAHDDEVDESASDVSDEDWEDGEGKAQEPVSEPSLEFEDYLNRKIVGQKGPIRTVAKAINLRKNGWIDPNRPLVLLFLGGSGVGKTELAKQIALHLYYPYIGDCSPFAQREKMRQMVELRSFIRLDMNEFQERHTVANITGPPKGYIGYDDKCSLTYGLDLNSSAIVLLDEIEKAHPDVLSVFLQIFDEGLISNSKMGTIHCENAVFIMTSNLAADEIKERSSILHKAFDVADASGKLEEYDRILGDFGREIQPILKECFKRDELIGRINQTVFFLPFDDEQVLELVTSQLNYWKQIAHEKDCIDLSWSMDVVRKLAKSYDQKFGARSIIHEIQNIAVNMLADAHIRGDLKYNSSAHFTTDDEGKIVLQVKPPIACG